MSLEEYSRQRPDFRARALAHRKTRQVAVGDHVTLSFEDRLTIQYQIQEMLRIEKAFEADEDFDDFNEFDDDLDIDDYDNLDFDENWN